MMDVAESETLKTFLLLLLILSYTAVQVVHVPVTVVSIVNELISKESNPKI